MQRIVYGIGFAVLAGLAGLIGLNVLSSPVDARREALEFRLENARSQGSLMQPEEAVDYEEIQYSISAKPNLWAPLTKVAIAPAPPPNLEKILAGITISPNTVGSGADIKVKIMTPENRAGQWVTIGGNVRGLTVKSIKGRPVTVVFMLQFQGREYTFTLTR